MSILHSKTASAAAAAPASAAASAPGASAPMNPAGAVIRPSNASHGANGKKERRSGLNATTQIVLGVVAAIAVLGGLVYLVRKRKWKFALPKEKLMFWKRWRRKKDQPEPEMEPQEPELGKDNE